ncbi:MAG: hypothetical protein NZL89_03900, partial [Leptospiraceae bacterium]|nr:hypothetical protein [Leptospiraceae bacterium]
LARGWAPPANLGRPYNSEFDDEYPSVVGNGKRVYFTSNRISGRGSYDIYHALLPDFARPVSPVRLAGKTLLAGSLRPVPAEVVLSAGPVRAAFTTEAKSGYAFSVELLNQRRYQISAHAPGYRLLEAELDTSTFFPDTNQEWDLLFVRDVKIPASVSLLLRCLDKEQNPLSAELNYRIMAPQQRSGKVRCGEKILLLGPTSASRDNPAVFLESLQIELKSNPKGFAPWRETFALSPLWDAYPQQIPEVVEKTIVLEPRRTSGKTKTKKTKGKRP